LASFNVENMFDRPRAMSRDAAEQAPEVLAAHARVNQLIGREGYDAATKQEILDQLEILGLLRADASAYAILRKIRGRFLTRHRTGATEVTASGRADWVGWVELTVEAVSELSSRHTAMVMRDIGAHVLGVVEAESRELLAAFSDSMLPSVGWTPYEQVMLVDGNDDRGIDVALLTQAGYPLGPMRSHIDDTDAQGIVFSRDCPEYELRTPGGHRMVVLVNHLKSKGYGSQAANNARRLRQAQRVADIYRQVRQSGVRYVAVLGDFNDTPESPPLAPLLAGTDLRDISQHPAFDDGGRPGTFGSMTAANRIDYLLLSPALFAKASGGGIYRMGAWGGTNGTLWPHYDTITKAADAASDHAAIYADVNLT
jgi:endonuclease/exonuclease/phosphatase family metal-dependent hydrolase